MQRNRDIRKGVYRREAVIELDEDLISASLSTTEPVDRFFGREVLDHGPDAIILQRAAGGLPMLYQHDPAELLGRWVNVRADDDGRLRGQALFDDIPSARERRAQVESGSLRGVSIGYRIHQWEDLPDGSGIRVTKWEPYEASLTPMPADIQSGIGRDLNDGGMTVPEPTETPVELVVARERARLAELNGIFDLDRSLVTAELERQAIEDGWDGQRLRAHLFELSRARRQDPSGGVHITADGEDKVREGITQALLVRCGTERNPDAQRAAWANEFFGLSYLELARAEMARAGIRAPNTPDALLRAVMTRTVPAHGVASLPNILADVINKSVQKAYSEAPETWQTWCRIGNLADFKRGLRPQMSAVPTPPKVPPSGKVKQAHVGDFGEPIALDTYAEILSISRQALINDDLDVLGRIPRGMGRAASRVPGDLAYGILISNPTLTQTGQPLFDASHNNIATTQIGPPTVAAVDEVQAAVGTQKSGDATLNLAATVMVVPKALEGSALAVAQSTFNPAEGQNTSFMMDNYRRGSFRVVSEARLDQDSALKWYMNVDPNSEAGIDTVEVAFLNGMNAPLVEQEQGWEQLAASWRVLLDCGAAPLDYRGLFLNPGA